MKVFDLLVLTSIHLLRNIKVAKLFSLSVAVKYHVTEYLRQLLQILFVMIRPQPDPLLNIRHRISNGQIENWDGCDAFSNFLSHRYSFYLTTREPSESLLRLARLTLKIRARL
jgi:hypothetical protein